MPYFRISDKYNRKILYMFLMLLATKVLLSLQYTTPWIFADEIVYDDIAKNIWDGLFISNLQYCQTYPPAYSIFLSIAYLFSENKDVVYHIMLFINAILTSSVIFPVYFILKKFIDDKKALLGSIIVAILPSVTLYSFALMSENLFIPLFLFSAWFIIESYGSDNKIFDFLAGFSVFFLFLTKATGIAMVLGFFASFLYYISINLKNKNIYILLKEKCFLLLSFFVPMLSWIIYKKFVISSNVIGYDTDKYLNILLKAFSSIDSFITILNLLLHEIEFLILASYFIMFFIVSFFIFKILKSIKLKIDTSLVLLTIYFLVSSSILILITIAHMYETFTGGDPYYSIFGRYIDPIIPLIFLLGFIGIDQMYKNSNKINIKITSALIPLYIFTILIFLFTFPYDYYKFPNMLSIFYIQGIKTIVPIETFIAIFSLISLVIFCLSINHKKLRSYLFLFFILFSIFISIYPFQIELRNSSNTENVNQIGRYLQKHSCDDTLVLMDREDFNKQWGPQMWFLTRFWMNGNLIMHSTKEDPSGEYTEYAKTADYIISTKLLPYQPVTCSNAGCTLYKPIAPEEQSIEVPYTIDIGLNDECRIENFHNAENKKIRWTKNLSKVLIYYPKDLGPLNLTTKTGGLRPQDNPAHVELYINGKKIGEAFKPSGTFIYSFVVPPWYYLNDYYQILEIKTNTWQPGDYGTRDKRDLGIQIDWIEIDKVEPKMLYFLSGFYGIEHWHNISTRWTSNNATISVYSTENRDSYLSFRALSLYKPRNLQVYLNDELIHEQKIPTSFVEVEIPVKLKEGENIIRFYTPDGCRRPCDIPELENKDSRCLSLAFQNITIT